RVACQAELDGIDRHTPAGRGRQGRIGLGRIVIQGNPRDGAALIVERERQGLVGLEPSARQGAERALLPAGRLDDPEGAIALDIGEAGWPAERVVKWPDLDPDAGTR